MTDATPGRRGTEIVIPFTLPSGTTGADFNELWFTLRTAEPASNVPNDDDTEVLFKSKRTDASSAITLANDATSGTVTIPAATSRTWLVNRVGYVFDVKARRATGGGIVWVTDGHLPIFPDITRSAS